MLTVEDIEGAISNNAWLYFTIMPVLLEVGPFENQDLAFFFSLRILERKKVTSMGQANLFWRLIFVFSGSLSQVIAFFLGEIWCSWVPNHCHAGGLFRLFFWERTGAVSYAVCWWPHLVLAQSWSGAKIFIPMGAPGYTSKPLFTILWTKSEKRIAQIALKTLVIY